jgi:hypothetical protein
MRGTFANIRIRNEMLDGVEGGYTLGPDGKQAAIYDAAMAWQAQGVPLVVVAGKEYGSGSSRDWAAKGTALLGVKAVIAESFERIHRSNLVGMGVIPLEFTGGDDRKSLGLKGDETISITGLAGDLKPLSRCRRRSATPTAPRRAISCAAGSIPRSSSNTSSTAACCTTCCARSRRRPEPRRRPREGRARALPVARRIVNAQVRDGFPRARRRQAAAVMSGRRGRPPLLASRPGRSVPAGPGSAGRVAGESRTRPARPRRLGRRRAVLHPRRLSASSSGPPGGSARRRRRSSRTREPRALIVEGPYRINRNPIYTGLILMVSAMPRARRGLGAPARLVFPVDPPPPLRPPPEEAALRAKAFGAGGGGLFPARPGAGRSVSRRLDWPPPCRRAVGYGALGRSVRLPHGGLSRMRRPLARFGCGLALLLRPSSPRAARARAVAGGRRVLHQPGLLLLPAG